MKKMLFVMNPSAGQKRANRCLPEILSVFNRAGYQVTTHITAGPGDGAQAVEKLGPDCDLVVCVGGDGTFNETVSGVLRSGAQIPLGYIPAGSTNDFAASLGLSTNPVQAAQDIVEGEPSPYDVGKFGENRYFSYVASFGAFTRTSYATPQNVKNALGHTAYLLEGISELSQIRSLHVRLEPEGAEAIEDDFLFGAISNSTSVGGVLSLDPKQVDLRDGRFELLLVRTPRDWGELRACIRAIQAQNYNCAIMTFLSAPRVRVIADPEMAWTLDGEREDGHDVVEAENLRHAIRLRHRRREETAVGE